MLGQFADDGLGVLDRIGIRVDRSNVDEVEQDTGALQVLEEADAEAGTVGGSFDQARDVGDDEALFGANAHDAEVGVQRGEGVVGDLRAGCGDGADQRALAGVGQAEQAHIGQDAQFEAEFMLFALFALGALARCAIGRGFEVGVAEAALAALGDQHFLVVFGKVGEHFAGVQVGDDGTDRHAQHDVFAAGTVAVGAAAVLAALAEELAGIAVIDQRIDVAVGDDVDAATLAAVAAVRAAHRDVFFAAEGGDAVTAVAGFDVDFGFVDEFHGVSFMLHGER